MMLPKPMPYCYYVQMPEEDSTAAAGQGQSSSEVGALNKVLEANGVPTDLSYTEAVMPSEFFAPGNAPELEMISCKEEWQNGQKQAANCKQLPGPGGQQPLQQLQAFVGSVQQQPQLQAGQLSQLSQFMQGQQQQQQSGQQQQIASAADAAAAQGAAEQQQQQQLQAPAPGPGPQQAAASAQVGASPSPKTGNPFSSHFLQQPLPTDGTGLGAAELLAAVGGAVGGG